MGIIRTEQTRLLQDNGTENIEFFVYDKNGDARAPLNQSKDVLKQVPSVMQPINSNLMVEYLRYNCGKSRSGNTKSIRKDCHTNFRTILFEATNPCYCCRKNNPYD